MTMRLIHWTKMVRTSLLLSCMAILVACGGRPDAALEQSEKALLDAALAKKCAPDEYAAAEKLNAKAKALADEGEHEKAEATAKAAAQLAEKAIKKAEERKEECLNPKPPEVTPTDLVEDGPETEAPEADTGGMKTVYFPFNASSLTDDAKTTLAENAAWLTTNSTVQIVIEGHCDQRGSTEYNLALGEKRAQEVRKYLSNLGIDTGRMGVVSYGEEQLADFGENDAAFDRNRRAEFRVSK